MAKISKKQPPHPEMQGLGLIVFGLFLFIAALSFSYQEPEKNWLGSLGYFLAFGGEYLFGWGIFLVPFYFIGWGVGCFRAKRLLQLRYELLYFSILLFSSCLLLT